MANISFGSSQPVLKPGFVFAAGAGPSLRQRLARSSRSNWSPESAEVRPLFRSDFVRMVPGSAWNWVAVNAVQQSNLNKKMKTKNMTTLPLIKSIGRRLCGGDFFPPRCCPHCWKSWPCHRPGPTGILRHQDTPISPSMADYRRTRSMPSKTEMAVSADTSRSTAGGQNLTFKAVSRVQSLMATRRSSVELSPISLQIVGQPFVFRVVDNGEEAPDPVDLVSDVNAPLDCGSGSLLGLLPIEAGNINVNP